MNPIDETAPNPQFVRSNWMDLSGTWKFRYDDDDKGMNESWWMEDFGNDGLQISVPYPPESTLSGIGDPSFHPVVWYQRDFPGLPDNAEARTLLRFGAVDYLVQVWVNDVPVGTHVGGSSPFNIELSTDWLRNLDEAHLTLRVFDDPRDKEQPRGKQAWTEDHADIWYKRTTGIWQPVWLEFVPETYFDYVRWVFDSEQQSLRFDVELNRTPLEELELTLSVQSPEGHVISTSAATESRLVSGAINLAEVGNLDSLLWSPSSPTLLTTEISTSTGDVVYGYVGLRNISVDKAGFSINGTQHWLRLVLSQGYFPESHYAAPDPDAIRREVELTLALGFNGARTHQKAEDPRYLYWADKLGLLVWGEIGAAYTFSDRAINALANEWTEILRRDINHPSIIAWVPFNESWGIGEVASIADQQDAVRSIFALTNAIDGTRPVIGNDGWEHVSTDVFSLHDYNWSGEELRTRYSSGKDNDSIAKTYTEAGKIAAATIERPLNDLPIMITEYGGVSFAPSEDESWYGYGKVSSPEGFEAKYRELTEALHQSDSLVGVCYTQLTDTEQETNGLLTENREPKIDIERLRAITQGNRV